MPKDDLKTIRAGGPWSGLNESADPRLIDPKEVADISNMVVRDGRLCPRPGYEELHADSLGLAFKRIYYSASVIWQISYCEATNYLYWAETTAIKRMYLPTGAVSTVLGSLTGCIGCAINAAGSLVYFSHSGGGGTISTRPSDGTGSTTDLATGEGDVCALALNETDSLVYWIVASANIRYCTTSGTGDAEFISTANAGSLTAQCDIKHDEFIDKIYWTTSNKLLKTASDASPNTSVSTLVTGSGTGGAGVAAGNGLVWFSPSDIVVTEYNSSTGASMGTLMSTQASVTRVNWMEQSTKSPSGSGIPYFLFFVDINGSTATINKIATQYSTQAAYPIATEWYRRTPPTAQVLSYYSKDIVWSQIVNDGSPLATEMVLLFPALGIQRSIQMGYHAYTGTQDGTPTIWSTDDRDSDPTYFDPFSSSSARCDIAWTGRGIDTAKGGWIVAQKGVGARVLNYVLSDTIFTFSFTIGTTGLWQFVFDGVSTAQTLTHDPTLGSVISNLLSHPSIDGVHITRAAGAGPPDWVYTVRIHGVWSGRNTPALTTNSSGGSDFTITVPSRAQTGGLDVAASGYVGPMVYCRPAGLPRPTLGTSGTGNWEGDQTSGTAIRDGYCSYRVTYYSSRWDLESPPSEIIGDQGGSSIQINIAGSLIAIIQLNGVPATLWFESSSPFRHIDYVRLYRRMLGTSSATDGVSADDDWYLISQTHIGAASGTITITDDNDPADKTGTKCPFVNEYPPDNAALVELHDDRAVYNSGDNLIWISELPKRGGAADGELGHEYVSNELFNQINRQVKNDFPITALKSHAGRLFIGTPERMLAIDTSLLTTQGTVFVDPMEGTSGVASAGCLCETSPLPDMPGYLLWLSPYGHVYAFNGATSQRLSLNLTTSVDDMVKKFWIDDTYFESSFLTLHYASMVVDPIEQRIILSTYDKNGTAYNLCYSIADKAWVKWTLGGYGLENGRLWTGTDKGKDIIVVGRAGGKLWKLMDGYADAVTAADADGNSFAWYATTKKMGPTSGFYKTKWGKMAAMFNVRNFSSTDASMTLTPIIGKGALTARNETSSQKDVACVSVGNRSHWVQLKISGTHTHLMDHAEISAVVAEYDPTVTGDLADTDNDPSS